MSESPVPSAAGDREHLIEIARLAAIGRLVPSLLHQLTTPLAAVGLRVESLGRALAGLGSAAPERAVRQLQAMSTDVGTVVELIRLTREFARPVGDEPAAFDLDLLCRDACQLLLHETMRCQVRLEQAPADGPTQVHGSEGRLRQAVLALLASAVARAPAGAALQVRVSASGPWVAVEVPDAGEPPPPLDQPFACFPVGLQLFACASIAREMHGSCSYQQEDRVVPALVLRLPALARQAGGM